MDQPIFLCYRRKDQPGYVARLGDDLKGAFGDRVFRDVESILAGENWQQVLKRKVSQARVVVALIGDQWESSLVQRRVSTDPDYIRLELNTAKELGLPVIPVLLGDAVMPDKDTLKDLAWLAEKQTHHLLDTQERWALDVDRLSDRIEQITTLKKHNPRAKRGALLGVFALVALIVMSGWFISKQNMSKNAGSSVQPVTEIHQSQSGKKNTQIGTVTGTLKIDNSGSEQVDTSQKEDSTQ